MLSNESDKHQSDLLGFFLVTAPGLEGLVEAELKTWLDVADVETVRGGVYVKLPLGTGLKLNRVVKTPNRILVRLADFGCRDFPKLFRKMSGFPWEKWLGDETRVEFQASSHTSRLRVKKRIEETCADGFRAHLKKRGISTRATPKLEESAGEPISVLVRFVDDVCTVSLDTSGELLHKRGSKPLTAEAPLRETIATSLLLFLENTSAERPPTESAGSAPGVELVDPMMGGGTFLVEAKGLAREISSRDFAFESLKPLAEAESQTAPLVCSRAHAFTSFVGYEASEKTWRAASENIVLAGADQKNATLFREDFFSAEPLATGPVRWVIANPPYGERLRVKGSLSEFYSRLFAQTEKVVRPQRALFLLPAKIPGGRLELPRTWKPQAELSFSNGGIPVVAHVFVRR